MDKLYIYNAISKSELEKLNTAANQAIRFSTGIFRISHLSTGLTKPPLLSYLKHFICIVQNLLKGLNPSAVEP